MATGSKCRRLRSGALGLALLLLWCLQLVGEEDASTLGRARPNLKETRDDVSWEGTNTNGHISTNTREYDSWDGAKANGHTTTTQSPPEMFTQNRSFSTQPSYDKLDFSKLGYHLTDKMLLCDHPPATFSPSFLGHSDAHCVGKQSSFVFTNTLGVCFSMYSIMYNTSVVEYDQYEVSIDNQTYVLFNDDDFISLCLPMFLRFNECTNETFFTQCQDLNKSVAFFHSQQCPRSLVMHYNMWFLVLFNYIMGITECISNICNGNYTLIDGHADELSFLMTNINKVIDGAFCGDPAELTQLLEWNEEYYITYNIHWPCCYPGYTVAWNGSPEEHGVNGEWSYLPLSCQAGEVVLMVVVACVGVSGVVGNLVVVVVMVNGPHRGQESSMLRTSLAFADLFVAAFVVVPSLYHHLEPFFTNANNHVFRETNIFHLENETLLLTVPCIDEGFRLFQAFLFCQCSIVSLLTVFLLSIERLVLTSRALRYHHYFTVTRVKAAIGLTWVIGLFDSLIFMYNKDGHFAAHWSTFNKLPISLSLAHPENVFYVTLYFSTLALLTVVSYCSFVFSLLAIRTFLKEEARKAAEWKGINLKAYGPMYKESRRCLVTQVMITVCIFTTQVPLQIDMFFIILDLPPSIQRYQLRSYICWWLFLFGTAFNPWIYNARSHQFRSDVNIIAGCTNTSSSRASLAARRVEKQDHTAARRRKMLLTLGLESIE
nr:uncharacterized protein LOC123771895 isoform X4 [Procambarus clarkii]